MNKTQAKKFSVILCVCVVTLIYFFCTLITQSTSLVKVNRSIEKNKQIYTQLIEENKRLKDSVNDSNLKQNIIQKAHQDGYAFEDETVFYDVG